MTEPLKERANNTQHHKLGHVAGDVKGNTYVGGDYTKVSPRK